MITHIYKKFKYYLKIIDKSIDNNIILCLIYIYSDIY